MMNNYIEHVELPSTGIIVNENSELAQFSDSCFYVLPSNKDLSLDIVRKHLDKLITSKKQFINRYMNLKYLKSFLVWIVIQNWIRLLRMGIIIFL